MYHHVQLKGPPKVYVVKNQRPQHDSVGEYGGIFEKRKSLVGCLQVTRGGLCFQTVSHHVDRADLELTDDPPAPASQVPELKMWGTIEGQGAANRFLSLASAVRSLSTPHVHHDALLHRGLPNGPGPSDTVSTVTF